MDGEEAGLSPPLFVWEVARNAESGSAIYRLVPFRNPVGSAEVEKGSVEKGSEKGSDPKGVRSKGVRSVWR